MPKRTIGRPAFWLPRSVDKPLQVSVQDGKKDKPQLYVCYKPLRLGYGQACELHLGGGRGPEVLLELNRVREPLRLITNLRPDELRSHVELLVNGEPLMQPVQELAPGSRVEVFDKATAQRFNLVVEPLRFWLFRPRILATILVLLTLAGTLYGGYLYFVFRNTQTELTRTEARLRKAETGVESTERRLQLMLQRIESAEVQLVETIEEYRSGQQAAERAIREEFDQRLEVISKRSRESLERLSEQDVEARRQLQNETRASIAALRQDLADKMIESYTQFKGLEERLFSTLAARVQPSEPEGDLFKRLLATSQKALVFVRTTYQAEFVKSGEIAEHSSTGTGFLVTPSGVGFTAQHVLYPWRFEAEFIVLEQLGLVRVLSDSVRWSLWLTGERVIDKDTDPPAYVAETAYHSGWHDRALRVLHVPEMETTDATISSPLGLVSIKSPTLSATDISVFQIMDFDHQFDSLTLSDVPERIEPLDDVLVIGYPYSRLQNSIAIPQAARGFVRRLGRDIMELDTPMHPGLSGGPILNRDSVVIGMAIGYVGSDVFGMAVRSQDLVNALSEAERAVRLDQKRLSELGCNPGAVTGHIDAQTWRAYQCEQDIMKNN